MRRIAILTHAHCSLFELGCAVELFALPRPEIEHWYHCDVVNLEGEPFDSTAGVRIEAKRVTSLTGYDTLVIPSWPTQGSPVPERLASEVRAFAQAGKRLLTFCSGAFLLAELGILDGRQATTHWRYAEQFKARFAKIDYVDDVLYVWQDPIGCSAGSAAALDLGLAVIRHDFGYKVANQVARRLERLAEQSGFESVVTLRHHFRRLLGVSPKQYQQQFLP